MEPASPPRLLGNLLATSTAGSPAGHKSLAASASRCSGGSPGGHHAAAAAAATEADGECERCPLLAARAGARQRAAALAEGDEEGRAVGDEQSQSGDEEDQQDALCCLFCQSSATSAYVPVHLQPCVGVAGGFAALLGATSVIWSAMDEDPEDDYFEHGHGTTTAATPLVGGGAQPATGARVPAASSRSLPRPKLWRAPSPPVVPYTQGLCGHRGCSACWLRWEADRIRGAAAAGEDPDLAVRCPVCHCPVDIRRGYDAVLCKPCQHDVVARGGRSKLAMARAKSQCFHLRRALGLLCLCLLFALQIFFSIAVWALCEQQIAKSAAARGAHGDGTQPPLMPVPLSEDPTMASLLLPRSGHHGGGVAGLANVTVENASAGAERGDDVVSNISRVKRVSEGERATWAAAGLLFG